MGSTYTSRDRRGPRRGPVTAVLAAALALTACAGGGDDAATADFDTLGDIGGSTAEASEGAVVAVSDAGESDGSLATGDRALDSALDRGTIGREVIIEMRVVLSSDDIQRSAASIMANAAALGGGVASSDIDYGDDGIERSGYALIVVKVPPDAVDRLLSGLADTGTVRSINQSATDVTDQLVDLDVRIDNARRSVANVREFMDRTENLNELVTLEAELTRRQTELEQLEARQRDLDDRVALSTITIEVVPTASVPDRVPDDDPSIGGALRSGWDTFTALIFGIGFVLAAALPFAISMVLLMLVVWLVLRRRDPHRRAPNRTDPISVVEPPDEVSPAHEHEPVG